MGVCFSNTEAIKTKEHREPDENPTAFTVSLRTSPPKLSNLGKLSRVKELSEEDLITPQMSVIRGFPQRVMIYGDTCSTIQESKSFRSFSIEGSPEPTKRAMKRLSFACVKGLKPEVPNQDNWCVVSDVNFTLIGVFDGHGEVYVGPHGHSISEFIKRELPREVLENPYFHTDPCKAFREAFARANQRLNECSTAAMEASISGTTATIVLYTNDKLYFGHVGDSRAMVCFTKDGHLQSRFTTADHKVSRSDEQLRIERHNGEVRKFESNLPSRLYLKGRNYPGIAVSRAFGDTLARTVGLLCEPEVGVLAVTTDDSFVIVASDGIWDYMNEEEVLGEIEKSTWETQINSLVETSWRRWLHHENRADDITVVLFSLRGL